MGAGCANLIGGPVQHAHTQCVCSGFQVKLAVAGQETLLHHLLILTRIQVGRGRAAGHRRPVFVFAVGPHGAA